MKGRTGRLIRNVLLMTAAAVLLAMPLAGCSTATLSPTSTPSPTVTSAATTQPVTAATSSAGTSGSSGTSITSAATTAATEATAAPSVVPTASVTPASTATAPATPAPATPAPASCTVSVVCHTAVANGSTAVRAILPPDGVILAPATVTLQPGDTPLSVLLRVLTDYNVRVVGGAYVSGIGNSAMTDMLYEKDCGPESGWLYYMNGIYVSEGSSKRILLPGDNIEWKYTCASGRDLS